MGREEEGKKEEAREKRKKSFQLARSPIGNPLQKLSYSLVTWLLFLFY